MLSETAEPSDKSLPDRGKHGDFKAATASAALGSASAFAALRRDKSPEDQAAPPVEGACRDARSGAGCDGCARHAERRSTCLIADCTKPPCAPCAIAAGFPVT